MPILLTENPEQLIYDNTLLCITVLGGVRLDGLDRMRVTLKVELPESPRPPLRHNLDLYNDVQLEKFIRKIAERLEVGTSVAEASLSELTAQLEQYRLEEIKKSKADTLKPKVLTEAEREAAEEFLKAPELMERTNELIGKSGILGEEINRLLMFVIFTSRKRQQPLHVVSLGASGTGKTHLQEKVGELMPEEDKIEITSLSDNAFYYFGQRELKHKLILIEDLDGAENALYPLRELQSKRKISKTITHKNTKGETKTIHLTVEGPVAVAGCTTREQIYEDNANRSFLIYLDESPAQDKKVMEYQRALSANRIDEGEQQQAQELMRNCQRLLQPVRVVNPYAELLSIPEEVLKPRRTNNHYLQFIEAITFYHQWQREQQADEATGEIYIETTLEDVAHANILLKETLLRKSDELTGACRNYLERVKSYLEHENKEQFTNREIRKALKENASNQKRYNGFLIANHYIKQVKGKKGTSYSYEVVSYEEFKTLRNQVTNALEASLQRLKNLQSVNLESANQLCPVASESAAGSTSPLPVRTKNEPVKSKKTKSLANPSGVN